MRLLFTGFLAMCLGWGATLSAFAASRKGGSRSEAKHKSGVGRHRNATGTHRGGTHKTKSNIPSSPE